MKNRIGQVTRVTKETNINLSINIDGSGSSKISTPVGFLNHMLSLFSFHSKIDINLEATGDIEVCDHHLVEDIGIALGMAIKKAITDEVVGLKRYSTFYIPMDETLAIASIDISGRPYLHFEVVFNRENIGNFSVEMVKEFFRAVAFNSGMTLHLNILYGENDHHKIEAIFKAFGKALKEAVIIEGNEVTSSKGVIY